MAACTPREVVLFGPLPLAHRRRIEALVCSNAVLHASWEHVPNDFERPAYQRRVLAMAYGDGADAGLVDLDPYTLARTAFAYLIQFAHDHNELLVQRLAPPTFLHPTRHLHLQTNSAQQLNAVGGPGEKSLLSILNRCATAFGGRLFKDRLIHPIHDVTELERRYDAIDDMASSYIDVLRSLQNVNDMERMARRLSLQQFAPMEWPNLDRSLTYASKAWDAAGTEGAEARAAAIRAWMACYSVLDLEECARYAMNGIQGNVFHRGVHSSMDALCDALAHHKERLEAIATAWTAVGDGDTTLCRVDSNDRDGWHITTTKKRWETLSKKAASTRDCTARAVSASSANVRITNASLSALSDAIVGAQQTIASEATRLYKQFLCDFGSACEELKAFVGPLAELDVHATHARNARDYGYSRPRPMVVEAGEAAYMDARGLRHPIIERVQDDVAYVPNDVTLDAASHAHGWLLYGMNAAGKSSLMKSIGLGILMAQSGMFVAAASMTFAPYHHIFTRIYSGDDIFRGMSTFVVEMTELRNILQRCTNKSLVLGDELCAGTEAISGVAIVGAGIEWLAARGATYVFATHIHELCDLPGVKALADDGGLRVRHMHVDVEADGTIIYDRHVQDGLGHRTYGLEVCRGLGLPAAFLATAEATRRKLMGVPDRVVSAKTSRYSRKVVVDRCGVCRAPATETHHIVYQKDCKDDAMVNHPSNLVPLCEACHLKEHAGHIKIKGFRATSRGVKLVTINNAKE